MGWVSCWVAPIINVADVWRSIKIYTHTQTHSHTHVHTGLMGPEKTCCFSSSEAWSQTRIASRQGQALKGKTHRYIKDPRANIQVVAARRMAAGVQGDGPRTANQKLSSVSPIR
jgi:hypothetical protein